MVLPKEVIRRIEGLCRKFLWACKLKGRRALVAWKDVTKPFDEGGAEFQGDWGLE